jgi:hypothetical protein
VLASEQHEQLALGLVLRRDVVMITRTIAITLTRTRTSDMTRTPVDVGSTLVVVAIVADTTGIGGRAREKRIGAASSGESGDVYRDPIHNGHKYASNSER